MQYVTTLSLVAIGGRRYPGGTEETGPHQVQSCNSVHAHVSISHLNVLFRKCRGCASLCEMLPSALNKTLDGDTLACGLRKCVKISTI